MNLGTKDSIFCKLFKHSREFNVEQNNPSRLVSETSKLNKVIRGQCKRNKENMILLSRLCTCLKLVLEITLLANFAAKTEAKSKIVPESKCVNFPCLIFEDNFEDFDLKTWEHEVTTVSGGNGEFQYYANNRSNSFVRDGSLYLKPTLTQDTYGEEFLTSGTLDLWDERCTSNRENIGCYRKGSEDNIINPVVSARVRTKKSFSYKYGRISARVKLPKGDWLWPAIWLMPTDEAYGDWPSSGEIDLLEARGNTKLFDRSGRHVGNKHVSSTLHWGPYYRANSFLRTMGTANMKAGSFSDDYHVFSLDWTKDTMHFYVDNTTILKFTVPEGGFWKLGEFDKLIPGTANPWVGGERMAPFDQDFFIIMNVAVGGLKFFLDGYKPERPWKNDSPKAKEEFWAARDKWLKTWVGDDVAMKIDYIRVWKLKSDVSEVEKNLDSNIVKFARAGNTEFNMV